MDRDGYRGARFMQAIVFRRLSRRVWFAISLSPLLVWPSPPATYAEIATKAQPQEFQAAIDAKPPGNALAPAETQRGHPPSEPAAVDVPSTLKQLGDLSESKKWRELAEACQSLADSSEEALKPFAALGGNLASALKDADLALKKKGEAAETADLLRRNAGFIDRPNPLDATDTSLVEQARKLRAQAAELESRAEAAIKKAEDRIAEAASAIAGKTGY